MKVFLTVSLVAMAVVASIAWKVSVWNECRQTNSFGYCWALISK